jgi:probable HAF family extracellular repeat protein
VTFNGIAASNVTPVSAAQLKATVPPGATTGKIAVTTPAGTAQSGGTFAVPLAITSFSPTSGPVGTAVTIHGDGFNNVQGVKFGNLTAGGSVNSNTQITAIVPEGAESVPITVSNGSVSVTTTTPFTVTLPVILDLGTLDGWLCSGTSTKTSTAKAINGGGNAAGSSCKLNGIQYEVHPVRWTNRHIVDAGVGGTAYGMNDAGVVVGGTGSEMFEASGSALVWTGGTVTGLGGALGGFSRAFDVNNNGQVVGYRGGERLDSWSAFVYDLGTASVTTLPGLGGTFRSAAYAINDAGQAAGYASTPSNAFHAVRWTSGVPLDLGTLGGSYGFASGINASGSVVGRSYTTGDSAEHAFLYENGSMQDLGTLGGSSSHASGINDNGLIVGSSQTASAGHAFFYTNGDMHDLNDCLPGGSGWQLTEAAAVNNAGQIVGTGQIGGEQHAFLINMSVASC